MPDNLLLDGSGLHLTDAELGSQRRWVWPLPSRREWQAEGGLGGAHLTVPLSLADLARLSWQRRAHARRMNNQKQHGLSFKPSHFKDYCSQLFQLIKP